MVTIERTFTIDRPVAEVFAYLCAVEHGPRYIAGQREAHQTSSGPLSIGTTFLTRSSTFPHRGTRFQVVDYEPGRRLAWKALSGPQETTCWKFEESGDNTKITFVRVIEASHRLLRLPESLVQELANERASRELAALSKVLDIPRLPPRTSYLGRKHGSGT
jgi:uncharacterized protein YndB with AHSA1/START domain